MAALVAIYVAGVAIGLWRTDAGPAGRLGLALLWPIGPIAFVVTTTLLVALAIVTKPAAGAAAGIGAAAITLWWLFA